MRIIQITDLHIYLKEDLINNVDTKKNFNKVLSEIKGLNFDFVVLTGDLSFNDGDFEVYEWIKLQLKQHDIGNYFVIGGNHDNASILAKVFSLEDKLSNQELYYFHEPNFIFLDTIKGYCSEEQLTWFANKVKEISELNPVIFMHHPPFKSGVPHMDNNYAFQQSEEFVNICNLNKNHSFVFCGHYHNEVTVLRGNITSFITPSTYLQMDMFEEEFKVGHYIPAYRIIDIEKEQIKTTVKYVFN